MPCKATMRSPQWFSFTRQLCGFTPVCHRHPVPQHGFVNARATDDSAPPPAPSNLQRLPRHHRLQQPLQPEPSYIIFCMAASTVVADLYCMHSYTDASASSRTTSSCPTTPGYEPTYLLDTARHRHFVATRDTSNAAHHRRPAAASPSPTLHRQGLHQRGPHQHLLNTPPPPCPQDAHLASFDRIFCKTRPR